MDKGEIPRSTVKILKLKVLDENDHAPHFTQHIYQRQLDENTKPGAGLLPVVRAIDPDENENGTVRYMLGEDSKQHFKIDDITGMITTLSPFDYEVTHDYIFQVYAYDLGTPSLTSTATVNINVINVNDNRPEFVRSRYNILLPEVANTGLFIGAVSANDLDEDSQVIYRITDPSPFHIDPFSGEIYVQKSLDKKEQSSYQLLVTAEDSGPLGFQSMTSTTTVMIHLGLEDINDIVEATDD